MCVLNQADTLKKRSSARPPKTWKVAKKEIGRTKIHVA